MRISSQSFYMASLGGMYEQQGRIAELSQQIASDKRFQNAREAPIDASKALEISTSLARREQFQTNQKRAESQLQQQSTALSSLHKVLVDARKILTLANPATEENVRASYAQQMANFYVMVKDLANVQDAAGNYLFAGYQTATQPYAHVQNYVTPDNTLDANGIELSEPTSYEGDDGVRFIQIDDNKRVQVGYDLQRVMQDAGTGRDLLQTLDQIAIYLRDGVTQDQLNEAVNSITEAIDGIEFVQTAMAGAVVQLRDVRESTQAMINIERDTLESIVRLDKAAAIIELQQRQTALEGAQRVFAKVSGLTLLNFI